jgi:hypothetical protein
MHFELHEFHLSKIFLYVLLVKETPHLWGGKTAFLRMKDRTRPDLCRWLPFQYVGCAPVGGHADHLKSGKRQTPPRAASATPENPSLVFSFLFIHKEFTTVFQRTHLSFKFFHEKEFNFETRVKNRVGPRRRPVADPPGKGRNPGAAAGLCAPCRAIPNPDRECFINPGKIRRLRQNLLFLQAPGRENGRGILKGGNVFLAGSVV